MGRIQEAISLRWLFRKTPEPTFEIPDTQLDDRYVPPAVVRHLKVIHQAMLDNNRLEVGNRQRRLAKLGIEVPTKPSHVLDLLRKYENAP